MSGRHRPPFRAVALALAFACALVVASRTHAAHAAPPADPPNAAALAEAKKLFERGLNLYKEKAYREALALFIRANELSPRASIQKNIAQCYRDLQEFAAAYDAYGDLLDKYGTTLTAAETTTIKNVIAELTQLTGAIRVAIAEPGANVRVDGRDVGTTPLAKPIRVRLERHQVVVTKQGFEPLTKDVDIAAGATVSIDGPLETELKTGHVAVTVKGTGDAHVFVDGEDVGPAPAWEGDLTPGVHSIEARGATVMAPPVRVDVARRARAAVSLELRARVGHVQVDSHSIDAEIAVDGNVVGRGAWAGDLPVGRHELSITLKGFEPHTAAIIVSETQTVEDVHMKPLGAAGSAPTYVGIYSNLDFFGVAMPGDATNGIQQSCPSPPCQASSPLGAGLGVRVGYSFGWLGVEGLALGMYDTSDGSVKYDGSLPPTSPNVGVARNESFRFHRYGGGGAVGGRFTTKHPNIRLTFGAALGIEYKGMVYKRDATATSPTLPNTNTTFTSSAATYTAPMIVLDLGILLGGATGPKFHIGALALFEMVGDPVFAPGDDNKTLGTNQKLGTPPLQMASGTQFFFGPVIGLHFGE